MQRKSVRYRFFFPQIIQQGGQRKGDYPGLCSPLSKGNFDPADMVTHGAVLDPADMVTHGMVLFSHNWNFLQISFSGGVLKWETAVHVWTKIV